MSWSLAIGFEMGAAASLAAIIILEKTNRTMVWFLFLLLTAFQMMANSYHAFVNLENYMGWIELFGLEDEEPLFQKRLLAIVSGAVLPVVALGFIKSLTDYVKSDPKSEDDPKEETNKYYESRNKHMEDLVEKRRRADNFKKAEMAEIAEFQGPGIKVKEKDDIELSVPEGKEFGVEYPIGIDAEEEINKEIRKQQEIQSKKTTGSTRRKEGSDELDVHVDEETGTTYVKTVNKDKEPPQPPQRNKMNPL